MRKLLLSLTASACLLLGLVTTAGPAHAAYGNSAGCNAGWHFYIHAPYPVGGGMQAWATCVPLNVNAPWPDGNLGEGARIGAIYQFVQPTGRIDWPMTGANYEGWRTIGNWGNTNIAAGGCWAGVYFTRVEAWFGSSNLWHQDTSHVYRNGVC